MYGLFSELPPDKDVAYGVKAHFKQGELSIYYNCIDTVGMDDPKFKILMHLFNKHYSNIVLMCKKWATGPLCPKSKKIVSILDKKGLIVKASMDGSKDSLYLIVYLK